jgi:hypothetical protein
VKSCVALFGGTLLLVSAWMFERAYQHARKYFPLQFADELSARYFMQCALFNPAIPWEIRRRVSVASALWMVAFAAFAAVAHVSGYPVIAVLLLLACGFVVANIIWQWRGARQ